MNTEKTYNKIAEYIKENANKIGYYSERGFEFIDSLEFYSDAMEGIFEVSELDEIFVSEIICEIENQIYNRAEVIGYAHAWHLIWDFGFAETQEICDELGYEKPFDCIESIGTAILQRKLIEDLYQLQDGIIEILDEAKSE